MSNFILPALLALSTSLMPALADTETYNQWSGPNGEVHFGTEAEPSKCCKCEPVRSHKIGEHNLYELTLEATGDTVSISTEYLYMSPDGNSWFCPVYDGGETFIPPCAFLAFVG